MWLCRHLRTVCASKRSDSSVRKHRLQSLLSININGQDLPFTQPSYKMSISQRDATPKETVTVKRSWPTWETSPRQGKDAIITEISNLFWISTGEAISSLISDTIDVAKRAGIDVTALSKKSISKPLNSSQPFSPTDEERAFTHVARCLLQAAGLLTSRKTATSAEEYHYRPFRPQCTSRR